MGFERKLFLILESQMANIFQILKKLADKEQIPDYLKKI